MEAAKSLFSVLSQRKTRDGKAIFAAPAREYMPSDAYDSQSMWVGAVGQTELDQVGSRNREVQSIADGVAADVRASGNYLDEQDFGNKVYARMATDINSMNDPDFEAEISCDSTAGQEVLYATKGSWRLDTLEYSRPATVCVYDHKTGRAFLRARRAADFADVVQKRFRGVQRIIVIQILAGQ